MTDEKIPKEAYAYSPGLKIKYVDIVEKERKLPILGEVLLKEGEGVEHNTLVAKAYVAGDSQVIRAASILGVEPEDLRDLMLKKEKDRVKEGELIARYSALFGLTKKEVTSPISGVIETISDASGQIIVQEEPKPVYVDAYIPGKVVKVIPKEGVSIQTRAAYIQGIFGIGGETHGKIRVLTGSERQLTAQMITAENKDEVLVTGSKLNSEALRKSVKVGAKAVVGGAIDYDDLTQFAGEEIGVGITGNEEVGITLIVTDGFGEIPMSRRAFELLKHYDGFMACVNGSTQIRAGVVRPEIIIPHSEHVEEVSRHEKLVGGIMPGTSVRLIRAPYFGAIGKVSTLPVELQKLETESEARVLEVQLENGKTVTVPRANVEIIEG